MRNGQRFTAVRDLISKRHRLRRAKIEGIVSQYTLGGRRIREWRGTATVPFSRANIRTAHRLLASTVTLRSIGDVLIDYTYSDGANRITIGLASTGVFKVPE